jgi:hypothetical protein
MSIGHNQYQSKSCIENIDFGPQVQSQLEDCVPVVGLKNVQCTQGGLGGLPPYELETKCWRHGRA